MKNLVCVSSVFLFVGCGPCYMNYFSNVTNYRTDPNMSTCSGIEVDSYTDVDLDEIDATVDRMERCLQKLIDRDYELLPKFQCFHKRIRPVPIRRCFWIKIVKPVYSKCSEWHFLKEEAPQKLCDVKGLEENKDCPCRWRWALQDEYTIVTPPGHLGKPYLYDIIKMHTGCNNYWASKELSECAMM